MTATPDDGIATAQWFLLARDGSSTLRISSGLTLKEDAAGNLKVLKRGEAGGWLRFDINDGVLWVQVLSSQWTLASGPRELGERLRLDGSLELCLPNHRFQIADSLFGARRERYSQVSLVRRAGESSGNVEVVPEARWRTGRVPAAGRTKSMVERRVEVGGRGSIGSVEARGEQREAVRRSRSGDRSHSRGDGGLESGVESRPDGRSYGAGNRKKEGGGTASEVVALDARRGSAPRLEVRSEPAPLAGEVRARASTRRRGSWADSVAVAVFLGMLGFSPQALPPTEPTVQAVAGRVVPATPPGGLGEATLTTRAEALVAANPDDPAILRFAADAYELALSRYPEQDGLAQRLRELEARLAAVTAQAPGT